MNFTNGSRVPRVLLVFSLIAVFASPAFAQPWNNDAVFRFDTTPGDDTRTSSAITDGPYTADSRTFTVTVVLQGADKLMGANCDIDFDETKLQVVSVQETFGDVNFDGRVNVFDVREIGARIGTEPGGVDYSQYFDLDGDDQIGESDLALVAADPGFNIQGLFVTSNDPNDLTDILESVEIFEDPAVSNQNGFIDDVVFVLLVRPGDDRESRSFPGDAFPGDARIASITFSALDDFQGGETEISFQSDSLIAIDSDTQITTTTIEGASDSSTGLSGEALTVIVPAP